MGGKGGGSTATNDQMVQMQMQQAAQTQMANAQRNARLTTGAQQINEMFQGRPAGAQQLNLAALPPGYMMSYAGDDGSGVPKVGLFQNGQLVTVANTVDDLQKQAPYVGGDPSKIEGGFGPDFYNTYTKAQLDYALPQETDQYNQARTNLTYQLARAGTLDSSIAGYDKGRLANQDAINRAQIASQADTQTGNLRNQIQQEQETALNQLYSTEDPSVAANTAQGMVANANLTKPILNPVGPMFSAITAGVGNAMSGFMNPYAYVNPNQPTGVGSTPGGQSGTGQVVSPG
jgi:hypothetical protein